MNQDEVRQFDILWNEIYIEGVQPILVKADSLDFSNLSIELFTKLYS